MRRSGLLLGLALCAWAPATLAEEIEARALLQPRQQARLSANYPGRIERVTVRPGQSFRRNQLLIRFDCSVEQAQASQIQAELGSAKQRLRSQQQLGRMSAGSELELALAQSEVKQFEAKLKGSKARLRFCDIRAPFNGRVSERHAHPYEHVSAGQALLDIHNGQLKVEILLPARALRWLKTGMEFTLRIQETGTSHRGKVSLIGAKVDPVSRSVTVEGRLLKHDSRLLPGMSGSVRLQSPGS